MLYLEIGLTDKLDFTDPMRFVLIIVLVLTVQLLPAQNLDSLKRSIVQLQMDTQDINLRMKASNKQFQTGILVSTLGYTITIIGGLMLGRDNDDLGQVLLVTGGATGATGTYIMVDSFNVLSGKRRKKRMSRP